MPMLATPKIYHIVHVDRLTSISADGYLWCDAKIEQRAAPGTMIGMNSIKQRRLNTTLNSHPDLHVGDWVVSQFDFVARARYFVPGCGPGFCGLGALTSIRSTINPASCNVLVIRLPLLASRGAFCESGRNCSGQSTARAPPHGCRFSLRMRL